MRWKGNREANRSPAGCCVVTSVRFIGTWSARPNLPGAQCGAPLSRRSRLPLASHPAADLPKAPRRPSFSDPTNFYGPTQRELQSEFSTSELADVHLATIVTNTLATDQQDFIQSRDFFFLSTVDESGWPTVSYKGGPVVFCRPPTKGEPKPKTLRSPSRTTPNEWRTARPRT